MEAALERAAQASTCDPGRWLQIGGPLSKWEEAVWPSTKVARSEKTNMFDLRFNLSTFGDTTKKDDFGGIEAFHLFLLAYVGLVASQVQRKTALAASWSDL